MLASNTMVLVHARFILPRMCLSACCSAPSHAPWFSACRSKVRTRTASNTVASLLSTSNLHPQFVTSCGAFGSVGWFGPEPFRGSIVFATAHEGPIDVDLGGVVLLQEHAHVVLASQLSCQRCSSCERFEQVQDDGANGGKRWGTFGQIHARSTMEGAVGTDGIRRVARTRHRTSRHW